MTERSIPHIRDIFGEGDPGVLRVDDAEDGKKKRGRRKKSEEEVKHLERHLSMKKTIRKKMMRDLQEALVAEPEDESAHIHHQNGRKNEEPEKANPKVDKDDDKKSFWRRFTIRKNKR